MFSIIFIQRAWFDLLINSFFSCILCITCFLIVSSIVIMSLYLAARINLFYDFEELLVNISQVGLRLNPLHIQEFMGFAASHSISFFIGAFLNGWSPLHYWQILPSTSCPLVSCVLWSSLWNWHTCIWYRIYSQHAISLCQRLPPILANAS